MTSIWLNAAFSGSPEAVQAIESLIRKLAVDNQLRIDSLDLQDAIWPVAERDQVSDTPLANNEITMGPFD